MRSDSKGNEREFERSEGERVRSALRRKPQPYYYIRIRFKTRLKAVS